MVVVSIKWGKQKFDNVEVDTSEPPALFKSQLFSLTGVPPERQKIMVKGGVLKDDADWSKLGLQEGQTLMLMGTAYAAAAPPPADAKSTVFVEDMAPQEAQSMVMSGLPSGLVNLGNTCYLNSTLQCLHTVPELATLLHDNMGAPAGNEQSHNVVLCLRDLFSDLHSMSGQPVAPWKLVSTFRDVFPQFAERTPQGAFAQQDAEECWTQLVLSLQRSFTKALAPSGGGSSAAQPSSSAASSASSRSSSAVFANPVHRLFFIQLLTTYKCVESADEPVKSVVEETSKLSVHPSDTKFLHDGIRKALEEQVTKQSPTLEREARYQKTSRIQRLPPYLTIQFVRFEWKAKEKVRAKILRDVQFPFVADVYEFCTDELKKKLEPKREEMRLKDEELMRSRKAAMKGSNQTTAPPAPSAIPTPAAADSAAPAVPAATPAAGEAMDVESTADKPSVAPAPSQVVDNETGQYELAAVLTHMGRAADAGHYVAWVKHKQDMWIKFDDDKVSVVRDEDIRKLSGGYGDWHIAYVCLYRSRTL